MESHHCRQQDPQQRSALFPSYVLTNEIVSDSLKIVRSAAKSWYQDDINDKFAPEKAYDGDYTTFYSVKDGDAEGNFLKLYLSQKHRIGTVMLTNRKNDCCAHRIIGTVVMVYSTEGGAETKVANCGKEITSMLNYCPPLCVRCS